MKIPFHHSLTLPEDTDPQRAALKHSHAARRIRRLFPPGTHVRVHVSGWRGVVTRHVPSTDPEGGYLMVRWQDGNEGPIVPSTVEVVDRHFDEHLRYHSNPMAA